MAWLVIFAYGAMVSYWLDHIAQTVANRYATTAAASVRDRLANNPTLASGGRTACPLIPADPDAWNRDTGGGGIAQLAWDAATAADAAIALQVQANSRFHPHTDPRVSGRAGFARITPGTAAEECELYVHVEVTPLGARLPLFDTHSTVCIDYTATRPPRPCAPADLTT